MHAKYEVDQSGNDTSDFLQNTGSQC